MSISSIRFVDQVTLYGERGTLFGRPTKLVWWHGACRFGALGGVQPGDRALFHRFPGGFDFGAEGSAGLGCLDEYCASVGGIRRPGHVAGALQPLKHLGHGGGVDAPSTERSPRACRST